MIYRNSDKYADQSINLAANIAENLKRQEDHLTDLT